MSDPAAYLVRTARQLRVLNSPARMAVVEAMMGRGAIGTGAIGRDAGMSSETVRYHLDRLIAIGLVRDAGTRETGARPRRLYELVSERIELAPEGRGPAFRRELARGGRLMLNLAEREFEQSLSRPDGEAPLLSRSVGWLTPEQVAEVREAVQKLESVLRESRDRPREGLAPMSVTIVGAPLDP